MAALMTLSQLSSGNSAYENYYRQVDPGNTGKIRAADAAQFLKKSGLSDSTLGKIWDLADPERKGFLDKRGFFIALRLVASAQGGNDISLNNLNQTLAAPKFKDANSPLLSTPLSTSLSTSLSISPSADSQWAVRPEEKGKFDGIFDSLSPVNGLLSGDKVKPVLINSKLPLDVLGRIWDLSDVDKDGQLDRDEFSVAMHLVYRAMENETTPTALPASLIPPSKRKKSAGALPGAVAVLPVLTGLMGSPPLKETLRSTPSLGSVAPINTSLSPKHSFKAASQPTVNWVVPVADRGRYDDIFLKTDSDMDGLVTGTEVIEIFMQSSLPQTTLAQIWSLADTQQVGKLSREQFSLAMYLIQQKVTKGLDPPQTITPDMIPPSERSAASAAGPDSSSSTGSGDLTGVKELDELSQEIAQLQREKYSLEQEIRDKEDAIRQKNNEVQEMQDDLDRESSSLQDLESQKQDAQERLEEMDQQRSKLEGMLNDVQQKCQDESHMISSLQTQIQSQETDLQSQEAELSRTRSDLSRLQQEEGQLEQSLLAGRVQLDSIVKSLKATQDEINQARSKLSQIQDSQQEVSKSIEQYNSAINGTNGGSMTNLADMSEGFTEKENGGFGTMEDPFKSKVAMFNSNPREPQPDPFQTEDPFKSDPFIDPFGGDPFKETDPFKGSSSEDFFKKADPFASSDPFKKKPIPPAKPGAFGSSDPFPSNSPSPKPKDSDGFGSGDAFGGGSYAAKGGFADFSQMSKKPDNPMLPPKKNVPNRPAPPYGKRSHANLLGLAALDNPREPVHCTERSQSKMASGDSTSSKDAFAFGAAMKDTSGGFADVGSFGNESDQLEWAKRESEREEQERLRRLRLQEQQDLDLAIALSKADMPSV
ncbi:epidermal growth factor receptor substrate 15-like 1 isoform X2 [Hypomesus transpacificus]|uniref:epidermal growth factor receptor substrate 15-like 1 isoform X2 n=1 Tax=Hypomesus transpacificus TaxID=137520 RepID=UPI001F079312|nr:epidermal growth factor receptor substrate 15-like 1 isoform X2 [Hypomesus transpacificus]